MSLDSNFLVTASELTLRFSHALPQPVLAFKSADQGFDAWRKRCTQQLAQLLAVTTPRPGSVSELRRVVHAGVRITALRMEVDERLSIPAYFLQPDNLPAADQVVMAIHGHGEVEACIGVHDDYHHQFGLTLAQHGYQVLCPELRGFGALNDLAAGLNGYRLDYWRWGTTMAYSLVTDGFLTGSTLLGETIADLLRWEH